MRTLLPVLLLAGCAEYTTPDEACADGVFGAGAVSPAAGQAVLRMNCFRKLAGLSRTSVDRELSDAAQGHARYFQLNGPENPPSWQEELGQGFTGHEPLDRMEVAGYDTSEALAFGYWEGYYRKQPGVDTPEQIVDDWMARIYYRQIVLQPSVIDIGWGQTVDYSVASVVYEWPIAEAADRPVVYPADGQVDVPTSVEIDADIGDGLGKGERGYPITLIFGWEGAIERWSATNPLDIVVEDAGLFGPSGRREILMVTPDTTPVDFRYSVAIVPARPLNPHTLYTVRATVTTGGGTSDLEWSFTTGE